MAATNTIVKTFGAILSLIKPSSSLRAITRNSAAFLSSRPLMSGKTMSSSNTFATFRDWRDYTTAFNANQPFRPKFPPNTTLPTLVLTLSEHHTKDEYDTIKSAVDKVCCETQAAVGKLSYLRWTWGEKVDMCRSNSRSSYEAIYFHALGAKLEEVMASMGALEGVEAVGISRSSLGCEGVDEDTPLALVEKVEAMRATEGLEKVRARV
ncbi:hypothetical protein Tdes44962_MAKER03257 [Teratosphaeria destructans]|uniref:Uncharacterized protein n=1 Tax=Teratosphaeria destructans TaxID=418781 RepID=A0A9W7W1Z2_9PEZI|nr:hypothetical protein Tdes44962_MAKER03257 [Teratosphaeria destructans]